MLRGLKCHGNLKAFGRGFEICSAWPFASPSLLLPELLTVARLLLFSTLQNSNYWKGQGGLRARVQQCLRGCASPRRPGSGAVRRGGAVLLGFYLDENILTNNQETNSSAAWEGEGELKGQACPWAPYRSHRQGRSFTDGMVVTNTVREEMPSQVLGPVFSHWCRT